MNPPLHLQAILYLSRRVLRLDLGLASGDDCRWRFYVRRSPSDV